MALLGEEGNPLWSQLPGGRLLTKCSILLQSFIGTSCGAAMGVAFERLSERHHCKSKTLQFGYLLTSMNTIEMCLLSRLLL